MIEMANTQVWGFEGAIRGMRMPMESRDRSDSYRHACGDYYIGEKDMELMKKLVKGGSEHRKFMRMIHVQVDITAGHTFLAEIDTYKVGTVRNSGSKMHRIHVKPFAEDMFDHEAIDEVGGSEALIFWQYIAELEKLRRKYNETHEKKYWRALIDMLPMGYHLTATFDLNYETLYNMYFQRRNHKMDEWHALCDWILDLPYMKELICAE